MEINSQLQDSWTVFEFTGIFGISSFMNFALSFFWSLLSPKNWNKGRLYHNNLITESNICFLSRLLPDTWFDFSYYGLSVIPWLKMLVKLCKMHRETSKSWA